MTQESAPRRRLAVFVDWSGVSGLHKFSPTEARGRWPQRCSLHPQRQLRARMVTGLRNGPFQPDNGLAQRRTKIRPWRTPSSSAKFVLLLRPAPGTKNCAAARSPVRRPLTLAPRPSLPLLLPVQRWERQERQRDIFCKIVKSNWNDGFASARPPTKSRILARRQRADFIFSENDNKLLSAY